MTAVIHKKDSTGFNEVYIGRPSLYGNLWTHLKSGETIAEYHVENRNEAIENYKQWLLGTKFTDCQQERRQRILDSLPSLKGMTLVCWCKPLSCHGDILKELIDEI